MHWLAPFSLGAFIIYLYMGISVFLLEPSKRLNRSFFYLCIFAGIWAFQKGYSDLTTDVDTVRFLYRYLSIGLFVSPALCVYFAFSLVGKDKILNNPIVFLLLFGYGGFRTVAAFTGNFIVTEFKWTAFGWAPIFETDALYYQIYNIYVFICFICAFSAVLLRLRKADTIKEKKTLKLLLFLAVPPFAVSFIVDIILPVFKLVQLPTVSQAFFLFLLFGVWYSMNKYRFLILTPAIAAEKIIEQIHDAVFLLDQEGKIISANSKALELLLFDDNELKNCQFSDLILKYNEWNEDFQKIKTGDPHSSFSLTTDLIAKSLDKTPFQLTCSAIRDKFNDLVGFTVIAHFSAELELLMNKYGITKREREIIGLMVKGLTNEEICETLYISLPTTKTHIHNIFQKIGVRNRMQLVEMYNKLTH